MKTITYFVTLLLLSIVVSGCEAWVAFEIMRAKGIVVVFVLTLIIGVIGGLIQISER